MEIILEIPAECIANMLCSAIESGDPVTTASRGGWCAGIFYRTKGHTPPNGHWYVDHPGFYEQKDFQMQIDEVCDETVYDPALPDSVNVEAGGLKVHIVRRADLLRGLRVMALKFSEHFASVLNDETDAATADIFLQCVVFGEEKYA
jgi:hypothetical protein